MFDLVRDMMDDWAGRFLLLLMALLIAAIPLTIYGTIQEQKEWDAFSVAHNCRVVAKISGFTLTGVAPVIGGNGGVAVTITSIPGKTGWQCDDGVTYYR